MLLHRRAERCAVATGVAECGAALLDGGRSGAARKLDVAERERAARRTLAAGGAERGWRRLAERLVRDRRRRLAVARFARTQSARQTGDGKERRREAVVRRQAPEHRLWKARLEHQRDARVAWQHRCCCAVAVKAVDRHRHLVEVDALGRRRVDARVHRLAEDPRLAAPRHLERRRRRLHFDRLAAGGVGRRASAGAHRVRAHAAVNRARQRHARRPTRAWARSRQARLHPPRGRSRRRNQRSGPTKVVHEPVVRGAAQRARQS